MLATLLLCSPRAGVLAGTATIRSRWAPVIKLCEASVQRASSPRARPPRPTPSQRPEEARRASHPTYLIRQAGQLRDSTRLLLPHERTRLRCSASRCRYGRGPALSAAAPETRALRTMQEPDEDGSVAARVLFRHSEAWRMSGTVATALAHEAEGRIAAMRHAPGAASHGASTACASRWP